MFAPNYKL